MSPLAPSNASLVNQSDHARISMSSSYSAQLSPHLIFCPCPVRTANGLSSAALPGSKLSRLVTYNPQNLTTVLGQPLPCEKDAGLAASAPKSIEGAETVRLLLLLVEEPSVCPFPLKDALLLAGPLAAEAAAERTAWRREEALAPRTVSITVLDLRMRKVGMLRIIAAGVSSRHSSSLFCWGWDGTHALMPYVPATSFCASTSILAKVMRPGLLSASASWSKTGLICLQGPHQEAVK